MKRSICSLLIFLFLLPLAACGKATESSVTLEPKASQMKAICELAVMDCYYHNVAKFMEENAEGFLWWQKDKHFWIEYSGVVTLGIDASLVNVEVNGTEVSVTMPKASVLSCTVDSASLTDDSFIVAKNSAKIEVEDEVTAFAAAQEQLEASASRDTALLSGAQQRAQTLLEDYIANIGRATGREYTINWVYLDGAPAASEQSSALSEAAGSSPV